MRVLRIVEIGVLTMVVLMVSAFAAISFDLMSYTATSNETLNPTGTPIGRALVVYSPGLSGAAKQDAMKIAGGLQVKNYTAIVAGVRSGIAGNTSGYNIIVVGGPMYFGKVSSSIDGYLKTLPNNIKLGVFASTGSSTYVESDFTSLEQQVASDTNNGKVVVKLILEGNETNDCTALVSNLMQ